VEMIAVRSSNVAAIGHDPDDLILEIEFLDGSLYRYYDVPEEVFHDFVLAPSKGRFVWSDIRDQYEYERVR